MHKCCLSIRQPWAWAILNAGKNVENRTWRTSYRGELFIHASKARPRRDSLDELRGILERIGRPFPQPEDFQFGALVGKCNLFDCVPSEKVDSPWRDESGYCLMLSEIQLIKPVPVRGALGIFLLPDQL